jgi:hypothetical protein
MRVGRGPLFSSYLAILLIIVLVKVCLIFKAMWLDWAESDLRDLIIPGHL